MSVGVRGQHRETMKSTRAGKCYGLTLLRTKSVRSRCFEPECHSGLRIPEEYEMPFFDTADDGDALVNPHGL